MSAQFSVRCLWLAGLASALSLLTAFADAGSNAGSATTNAPSAQIAGPAPARRYWPKWVPTEQYTNRAVAGWLVYVNRDLFGAYAETGTNALALLEQKLSEIARLVPKTALAHLRKVPLWLGVNDGHGPCAEYHISEEWLAVNGYNVHKAKAVEIGSAATFLSWSQDQPMMILHELAHAYHDQVLGQGHSGILAAYQAAVAGGKYDAVARNNGRTERAYALSNEQEYFAEATEAYFGQNDYFPFNRAELKRHDPEVFRLLERVWGVR